MIIVSYQGPNFTDVRAVRLAPALDPTEYIAGLPEGACGIRVTDAHSLNLTNFSVISLLYNELAGEDAKFSNATEARDKLFVLLNKVAKPLAAMPAANTRYMPDAEAIDAAVPSSKSGTSKKPRAAPVQDEWSTKTTDELSAAAKAKGYAELPSPNGGVRKMRLLNFLRKQTK